MINYYEQGGAAQEDQQDAMLQKAIIGFYGYQKQQGNDTSIQDVVSQVAQLISKQPETLEQIAASDELVEAGAEELENDNPEAFAQLSQPGAATQLIQAVVDQASVQSARRGAKLNFIRSLKGECPEGYYKTYYAAGGSLCPVCKQKEQKVVQSAKCGKKMKKGVVTKAMNGIRTEMYQNGGAANKPSRNIQVNTAKAPDGTIIKRTIIPDINPANNDTIYSERVYYPGLVDENGKRVEGSGGYVFEPAGVYHWDGLARTEDKNYQNLKNKFGKARIINTKNIPFTNSNADRYRGFSYTE